MSSGASEPDRDAAFASLSGPALVAYLRSTCRRADYDAAARVLDARDRRLARAEAQLAELQPGFADANARLDALRKDYLALRAEHRALIRHPSPGAIAGPSTSPSPAPRADGCAEGAGKEGAEVVDLRGGGEDWEDGEFRPDAEGVSCKAKESAPEGEVKEPAPEGGQRRRAGVSCQAKESAPEGEVKELAPVGGEKRRSTVSRKRKPPLYVPSSSSSDDDEEDRIPLRQLSKKRRGAKPVPNGKPKKGHGDVLAKNSVGPLGDHPPEKAPVNRVGPKASAAGQRAGASRQLKAATFLQRKRKISQPGEDAGLSRAMPSPPLTDSAVGNKPRKNSSMADGAEDGGPSPSRVMPSPPPTDSAVGNKPLKNGCAEGGPSRVMPTPPSTDSAVGNKAMKNSSMIDCAGEGGPSRVMPTPQPIDSSVGNKSRKNSSKSDGAEDRGQSRVMAIPLPTGSAVGNCNQKNSKLDGAEDGGPSRTMSTPPCFAVGNYPLKNSFKADGAEAGASIGENKGAAAGPQGYRPFQVRTPSHYADTARKIVESVRGGAEMSKNHTGSGPDASTIREKGGINGILPVASILSSAVTNKWKSASDVYTSCLLNSEVCMEAACALHRQRKLAIQGGQRGYTLSKYDVHRASLLVEFLLAGNLQGPLKRTAEELANHDSEGFDLLVRVATEFSEKLFGIYRNKEDPYFR